MSLLAGFDPLQGITEVIFPKELYEACFHQSFDTLPLHQWPKARGLIDGRKYNDDDLRKLMGVSVKAVIGWTKRVGEWV